jgi:hypothetical protein
MSEGKLSKDQIMKSFRKRNIFERLWTGIKAIIAGIIRLWEKIPSKPNFKKGTAWGAAIMTAFLAGLTGFFFRPGIWRLIDVPAGILMILIFTLLLALLTGIVFGLVFSLITLFGWRAFMALGAFICLLIWLKASFTTAVIIGLIIVLTEAVLGGFIAYCFTSEFKFGTWVKKGTVILGILALLGVNYLIFQWIVNPGNDLEYILLKNRTKAPLITPGLNINDPTGIGTFQVISLTYGSENNQRRPEFGKEADLKSKTVDLRPFLGEDSGLKHKHRQLYWGFDCGSFPLNGNVWLPPGQGPYPLIILVHGEHRMEWPSDRGLAYLGRFLATRGFICVAIDQNVFNPSWSGRLNEEIDGRAWMILQHLTLWKKWNETRGNPFHQKVDMNRIGLLGHDRGAVAAARASLFNRLPRYPKDARIEFDFNFNIESLALLSPGGENSIPNPEIPSLADQNLLCLQGVHDSLSSGQWGAQLYNTMSFDDDPYRFKCFIISYRSNHRQFNSEWFSSDYDFPFNLFSNRKLINSAASQQQIGCVFTAAFFETTLKKNPRHFSVLRYPGLYARWLPDDYFVSRFEDSQNDHLLCTFDEDADPTTGTSGGVTITGRNLLIWKESANTFQGFDGKNNRMAIIGWEAPGKKTESLPRYTIEISDENEVLLDDLSHSALQFSVADGTELFLPGIQTGAASPGLDFSIEMTFGQEQKEQIFVANHLTIPRPVKRQVSKLAFIDEMISGQDYRLLLQTVEIPISAFFKDMSELNLKDLKFIRFIFDRSKRGVILLDSIGFVNIHSHFPVSASILEGSKIKN